MNQDKIYLSRSYAQQEGLPYGKGVDKLIEKFEICRDNPYSEMPFEQSNLWFQRKDIQHSPKIYILITSTRFHFDAKWETVLVMGLYTIRMILRKYYSP